MPRLAHRLGTLLRPLGLGLLLALLLPLTSGWTSSAEPALTFEERLDALLNPRAIGPAIWGVYVRDLDNGRVLYRRNAAVPLLPASTQKILTTAGILDLLGSTHRFETTLHLDGRVDGTVLRGDVYLRGSGDPSFGSAQLDGSDPLEEWAERLAEIGITRVEGRLIGDDDVFDDRPWAEGWDIDYLTRQAGGGMGVSTSGLAYRDNVVRVRVQSTRPGEPARIVADPPGFFELENDVTTSGRSRGGGVRFERRFGEEGYRLYGSVPRSYRRTLRLPVTNPTQLAVHSLAHHLREAGITVDATLWDVDDLPEPPNYARTEALLVHYAPPLASLAAITNKESNNVYAEHLFRILSRDGSVTGSERRLLALLERAGAPTAGLLIRDGSGLSRKDLISAEALGELLAFFHAQHPERSAFVESLAAGGEPSTTLESRLEEVPVRAKTGSLRSVRTLSGYVEAANGHTLAFAILANNYGAPSYRINQVVDQMVVEMTQVGVE